MNEHLRIDVDPSTISPTVRKLMERRWTVAEIMALGESIENLEDEHFELIHGEIVPLASKGNFHERLKGTLNIYWARRLPDRIRFIQEATFILNKDTFVEPDFVFFPTAEGLKNLRGDNALLAVEVADTSLSYDLGRKRRLYASFGIRELWVINAVKLTTHVFSKPMAAGYSERRIVPPSETLIPDFTPELAVCLSELEQL